MSKIRWLFVLLFCNPLLYGQTLNTMLLSGSSQNELLDSITRVTFDDSAAVPVMKITMVSGVADSIAIDSIHAIFFDVDGVVPVELSTLTAGYENGSIIISWTTQSEKDNLGWNVLRSSIYEGPYEKINSTIVSGSGTTAESRSYSYTDPTVSDAGYFYKLEQTDLNGTKSYSWIVSVGSSAPSEVDQKKFISPVEDISAATYPNPVSRTATLSFTIRQPVKISLEVYSQDGHGPLAVLHSGTFAPGRYHVTWDGTDKTGRAVKNGTYLVVFNNGSGFAIQKTLIIR